MRQRFPDMKLHSLVNSSYFDPAAGLVSKPPGAMGAHVPCPASWAAQVADQNLLPPGVFEALGCTVTDLVDWPATARDGFVFADNNQSTVANAYVALAARAVSEVAGWLGEQADAAHYANVSTAIAVALRGEQLCVILFVVLFIRGSDSIYCRTENYSVLRAI